ncbi:MAG: C4-type zinc ribbon domain-containing protein [Treponema sp.]|jgi:predicted  nucleic acid-binding Zn-ribbon protein|nr:C4-type zinc ribbon domain-containing protein [Treponema sp.]
MAMDEVFDKLRSLQDILSKKIELEQEIEESPKILTDQEEVLSRYKRNFIEENQEYEKTRATAGEFRNLLFEAESSRERAERNIGSAETFNMREYEILDKERRDSAEKEQQYRKDVQREERVLSDLNEEIKRITGLIELQEAELSERRKRIDEDLSAKKSMLVELEAQEKEISSGLDEEMIFKFDRIIRHKMGKGIVAIKGGVCTGCYMILPAQFANRVHKGEEILFCPYCSRILFYEESDQSIEEEDYFNGDTASTLADLEGLDEDEDEEEEEEEEEKVSMDFDE